MKLYSFRLKSGQDLIGEIEKFAHENNIQAGFMITCVAGLEKAVLRMAVVEFGKPDVRSFEGPLEVVSLVGTVSINGCHLHITASDKNGHVFGGHLKTGSPVRLTAEIVIGEDTDKIFKREVDSSTGYEELAIYPRNQE
jgi:predicted DNA-binding protein with PD1-like motif